MVRRVTRDMVSVFIATSIECEAQLAVRRGRHGHEAINDDDFDTDPPSTVTLDRLGERLWVGLVQAALPAASSPGQVFSYDIRLIPPWGSPGGCTISTSWARAASTPSSPSSIRSARRSRWGTRPGCCRRRPVRRGPRRRADEHPVLANVRARR
jgi:hypothetical protein